MIDERHLNGTTGESKSYTVTNKGNTTSTSRNLYYEQLQKESDGDYVEVVRCKDCIYQAECAFTEWLGRNGNGFCSCGERKEDAETN